MQGVGGEDGIEATIGPGVGALDVEFERRQHVGQGRRRDPGANAGMMFRQVAGLPLQVWHRRREVDGVLAGTAADLEHVPALGEALAQHGEDRIAVAAGGGRVGQVDRHAGDHGGSRVRVEAVAGARGFPSGERFHREAGARYAALPSPLPPRP